VSGRVRQVAGVSPRTAPRSARSEHQFAPHGLERGNGRIAVQLLHARQQILQNAGTAMVAQANAVPEQVLTLLKGI